VPGIAVVHLVRRQNGLAPLERFLASYREHAAGVAHELVILFKGFRGEGGTRGHDALLEGLPHRRLFVPDRGFDLRAYFAAVTRFEHRYFCFLNSFSRILEGDWLAKLHRGATAEGVGMVGATGSYQSFASAHAERARMLGKLPAGERLRWRMRHILSDPAPRMVAQRAGAWVLGSLGLWDPARYYPPFPNYHLRTNAFMASRDTLQRIRTRPMPFKLSAYFFESGRDGLTRQVLGFGLRALLIARNGEAFEKERWHLSDSFRQGRQENLLVADNQTDFYANADAAGRAELSRLAWGEYARPA
jgi:hypothetical protein